MYAVQSAKYGKDKRLPTKALDWTGKNLSCLLENESELLTEDRIVIEKHIE